MRGICFRSRYICEWFISTIESSNNRHGGKGCNVTCSKLCLSGIRWLRGSINVKQNEISQGVVGMKHDTSCKYPGCWGGTPRANRTRFPTSVIKSFPRVVGAICMGVIGGCGVFIWFRHNTRFLQMSASHYTSWVSDLLWTIVLLVELPSAPAYRLHPRPFEHYA